jgi:hypothetical protein
VGGAGSTAEVHKQIKLLIAQWTQKGGEGGEAIARLGEAGEDGEEADPRGSEADEGLPADLPPAHGDCGDDGCEIVWD